MTKEDIKDEDIYIQYTPKGDYFLFSWKNYTLRFVFNMNVFNLKKAVDQFKEHLIQECITEETKRTDWT